MQKKEFDDFKNCRVCKIELNNDELEIIKNSKMPALCREHMERAKEQFKKCAPLMQKMKL